MAFWLLKSEPDVWGWSHQVAAGKPTEWYGVRSYAARNNMRAMQVGELGFFYHSNVGKEIVGILRIAAPAHHDSTTDDERWECVDVEAVEPLPRAVTLEAIKREPGLENMALIRLSRLSVQPVKPEEWAIVCRMGGLGS